MSDSKATFFKLHTQNLEFSYTMFSISLDEALELRRSGQLNKAQQAVCVTPDLCHRLAVNLSSVLHAVSEHSKHYGIVPNTVPLDPQFFRGIREQRSVKLGSYLNKILLSNRSQFLYKTHSLHDIILDLDLEYTTSTESLLDYSPVNNATLWQSLDSAHFDLNTCFRETEIMLKSFLVVLPEEQLPTFSASLQRYFNNPPAKPFHRARVIRHRRMSPVPGK